MGARRISRGDVESRGFWKRVAIGTPDVDMGGVAASFDPGAESQHWYWVGESPLISGHWKPSGEKPHRVLFSELRPEEWDGRIKGSPLENVCGISECINPRHWEFVKMGVPTSLAAAKRQSRVGGPDYLADIAYPDTGQDEVLVEEVMLNKYVDILTDPESWAGIIDDEGWIHEPRNEHDGTWLTLVPEGYKVITELQRLIRRDPPLSLADAQSRLDALGSGEAEQVVRRGSYAMRLAQDAGAAAPSVAVRSEKPRVKPRPRRV